MVSSDEFIIFKQKGKTPWLVKGSQGPRTFLNGFKMEWHPLKNPSIEISDQSMDDSAYVSNGESDLADQGNKCDNPTHFICRNYSDVAETFRPA